MNSVCSGCVDALMFLTIIPGDPRALHCDEKSVLTDQPGGPYLTRARLVRKANHDNTISWKRPEWCPKK